MINALMSRFIDEFLFNDQCLDVSMINEENSHLTSDPLTSPTAPPAPFPAPPGVTSAFPGSLEAAPVPSS